MGMLIKAADDNFVFTSNAEHMSARTSICPCLISQYFDDAVITQYQQRHNQVIDATEVYLMHHRRQDKHCRQPQRCQAMLCYAQCRQKHEISGTDKTKIMDPSHDKIDAGVECRKSYSDKTGETGANVDSALK